MFKFSSDTGDKKRRPGRTASRTVRSGGARRVSVAPKNRGLSWVDRVDWGKARIAAVVAIFCVLWLGLWGRAWYLQMIEGPRLADKARRQHMATELVTGKRGMIMDRNGQVLARSVEARSVYARPQEIQDFLTMANTLGPILGIEPQKLYDELSKTKRRFVWVRRKVDDYTAEAVRKAGLPGIGLSKEYDRVYPFKHLAGQLLGFVGVDDKGLEGLERSLDDRLAGTPTRMVVQRDAMGRRFYLHEEGKDELRGEDLMLTLDVQLQFIAEEAVARAARDFDARWSGALVVDVPSGDILAWAQYPFFNPNTYRQSSPMIYRNRLASDALEPGSTFRRAFQDQAPFRLGAPQGGRLHRRGRAQGGPARHRPFQGIRPRLSLQASGRAAARLRGRGRQRPGRPGTLAGRPSCGHAHSHGGAARRHGPPLLPA